MDRIAKEVLELLNGKMITEKEFTVMGFKNKLKFEIYDGFAYCPDYKGKEYCMIFPRLEFVNKSTEMQDDIRKYMGMTEDEDITILEILQAYNEMIRDGVRVEYDEKNKCYKEKEIWKI